MSLHTIVSDSAGRLLHYPRRARVIAGSARSGEFAVRLRGASMWMLEAGLAATAVATALLIGLAR